MIKSGKSAHTAMYDLASLLRLGMISAKAQFINETRTKSLDKAWREAFEDEDDQNESIEVSEEDPVESVQEGILKDIPRIYWRSHHKWLSDVENWRWPTSCFHVTDRDNKLLRKMLRGVHFSLQDLSQIYPDVFGDSRTRKRGPQRDDARRTAVWKKLLEMALAGTLTDAAKISQETMGAFAADLFDLVNTGSGEVKAGKNIIQEISRTAYPLVKEATAYITPE